MRLGAMDTLRWRRAHGEKKPLVQFPLSEKAADLPVFADRAIGSRKARAGVAPRVGHTPPSDSAHAVLPRR
jgi:hypothetical protein